MTMKNILVVTGASNCSYSIFSIADDDFKQIFPGEQDIEFFEDLIDRLGEKKVDELLVPAWSNRIEKKDVQGIHGTLFYKLRDVKKKYYPNKKDSDIPQGG